MRGLIVILAIAAAAPAFAEPFSVAAGVAPAWQRRRDFGAQHRGALAPEIVAFGYLPLAGDWLWLRPGTRLGYVGITQAEMPSALKLEERDAELALECGLVLDGPVMPSFTVGGDLKLRFLELEVEDPVMATDDRISGTEALVGVHAQLGLGIPFARGAFVLEPFVRWERVAGDERIGWRFGAELTVRLF